MNLRERILWGSQGLVRHVFNELGQNGEGLIWSFKRWYVRR